MHKKLTALMVAAIIGLMAVATPNEVEARWRGWWIPGAIAGGLALGAIASGAYRPYYPYYYDPGRYYGPYEYDYGPYEYGPAYYGGTHYYYPPPNRYYAPYKHWTEF